MTELRLSDNPAWEGDRGNTKGDKHDDLQRARFICPVVGLEMNGRHRCVWGKDAGPGGAVPEPGSHTGPRGARSGEVAPCQPLVTWCPSPLLSCP